MQSLFIPTYKIHTLAYFSKVFCLQLARLLANLIVHQPSQVALFYNSFEAIKAIVALATNICILCIHKTEPRPKQIGTYRGFKECYMCTLNLNK